MQKANTPIIQVEDDRTGVSPETLKIAFADNLFYEQGKSPHIATKNDFYMALAYTVRDRLLRRWLSSIETYIKKDVRVVCYLSAEFLMGPQLENNLINMDIYKQVEQAVSECGLELEDIIDHEAEPGLGNGGLGRLAACYMDSMATLDIPAIGYGLRYEFGIFGQLMQQGWQVEVADKWLRYGYPWELPRPERRFEVKFGGHMQHYTDDRGRWRTQWVPDEVVDGVAYDTPVPGYRTNNANTLRLWKAESRESFDFHAFNAGDYIGAVIDKVVSENITKVLYPNDNLMAGKQLRLEQEYFLVSCTIQDIIRFRQSAGHGVENLHEKFVLQLNDTHPSIAVAELMRILVDDHLLDWDRAWEITSNMCAYTNHTLLPEALEKWPITLFESRLPRHLEIIYEINERFLTEVRARFPGDEGLIQRVSCIDESGERYVRMAHLACIGSFSINGVAKLHSELLKSDVLKDFYHIFPEKFNNKTNGVTPRRFMAVANPQLTELISTVVGDRSWLKDLDKLKQLEYKTTDGDFAEQWSAIKLNNKARLADYIKSATGVIVDPQSMFDIQVKRIHEYKRQHLNILHIITLYNRIKKNPSINISPRTFIFAGKAAPGYFIAKLIIKLISSVAHVINHDRDVADRLKVVFVPDFNVKLGQIIYPAADLSEQISTAGKEASGTGNMKFALNGALTIGTLDGANVEILEAVGQENFFLFGLKVSEVAQQLSTGYNPYALYQNNMLLKEIIDQIANGYFSRGDKELFKPLVESLIYHDPFLLLADYNSYIDCQSRVSDAFLDIKEWTKKSILNVARMGKFSSDRSISEYCHDIWKVGPVPVELADHIQSSTIMGHGKIICE